MFDVIKKGILDRLEKYKNEVFVEAGKDCPMLSIKGAADYICDNNLDQQFAKNYIDHDFTKVDVGFDNPELTFIVACYNYRRSSFKFQLEKVVIRAWNLATTKDEERGVVFMGMIKGGELELLDELMDELE